jgi:hypothetical protein
MNTSKGRAQKSRKKTLPSPKRNQLTKRKRIKIVVRLLVELEKMKR